MVLFKTLSSYKFIGLRNMSKLAEKSLASYQFKSQNVEFFMKNLDLSKMQTFNIFSNHPNLHTFNLERLTNAYNILINFGYTKEELVKDPRVLTILPGSLEQHYLIFKEAGFSNITTLCLRSYISFGRKPIRLLKAYQFLDDDVIVHENILKYLDSDFNFKSNEPLDDNCSIRSIRANILHEYLKWYLQINDTETNHLFKTYVRIKNKSFQTIRRTFKQLDNLGISKDRIKRNGYLIHSSADNIKNIMNEVKELAGLDIKEVVQKVPKLLMTNYETLIKTNELLKEFNISNESIRKCWDIFTLSSDTVYERLHDLDKIPEFKVLKSHPRILRLVHFQKKVVSRLNYLQDMRVKCASLHILSSTRDQFEKYAKEGSDRSKGKDLVSFLAQELQISCEEIREQLRRHSYWLQVPVTAAAATLSMLKEKSFLNKHIVNNIHIVLYPKTEVERVLDELSSSRTHPELPTITDLTVIESSKILAFCLYIIEKRHHFTCNGIWDDHLQQEQVFIDANAILPQDTLGKNINYRYMLS